MTERIGPGAEAAMEMALNRKSTVSLICRRLGPVVLGALSLVSCQTEAAVGFQAATLSQATLAALVHPSFLVDPQTAERYRQQGLAYRQQGDLERAIAALKIAAALDPQNPNSSVILGWTQHLAGYRAPAAEALQAALRQNPDNVPALNALGIVYLVDGQLDAAVATHIRAADLQPGNEIAHYNLSLAYERLGQANQAIAQAQTATELEPGNPHPWVALALAYWANGDQAAAEAPYRQALGLDGGYGSREYLNHLEQAGFSPEQIETTEAIRQRVRD